MNDTHVTVVGTVVNSPRRNQVGDSYVTNFRIGSNARRYDSAREEWTTSGSFYADVECWGELGGNVVRSIAKGHAVVVTGTLTTREWETENGRGSTSRIRAEAVGPNLRWTWAEVKQQERATASADGALNGASAHLSVDEPGQGLIRGRDYQDSDDALDEENSGSEPQPVHA